MHNRDLDWRTWLYIVAFAVSLFAGLGVTTWLQLWADHFAEIGYRAGSSLTQAAQALAMVTSWIGAGLALRNMDRHIRGSA